MTSKAVNGRLGERGLPGVYDLKKIWHPSWLQGNRKTHNYFEGWYYKLVSADRLHSIAFIPGFSRDPSDTHAFVQVIDGTSGKSWYYRFPAADFHFSKKGFTVNIAGNHFSANQLSVNLQNEHGRFNAALDFKGLTPYPGSLLRPGIMGWYRYVPFMECYHGVVSLDHEIQGKVHVDENTLDFSGGRGYIEKDWGSSMPSSWIWMQTNHFDTPQTSFMLSVARIPWMKKAFTGFLGFFLYQNRRYDFATYTGAKITQLENTDSLIRIRIVTKSFTLDINGEKGKDGKLKAPRSGNMQRVIHESINASIRLVMTDNKGHILYKGTGTNAGLELVDDISILKP